jgi:hypothetical protein
VNFVCYFFPFQETQFQQKSDLQSQRQARSLTPTDGTPIISGIMKRNETSMLQLQIDQLDKHPHSPRPQLKYFGASWAALKKCFPSWRILLQLDYCMWWPGYCSSFFQASWPGVSIWIHISLVVISKSTSYLLLVRMYVMYIFGGDVNQLYSRRKMGTATPPCVNLNRNPQIRDLV